MRGTALALVPLLAAGCGERPRETVDPFPTADRKPAPAVVPEAEPETVTAPVAAVEALPAPVEEPQTPAEPEPVPERTPHVPPAPPVAAQPIPDEPAPPPVEQPVETDEEPAVEPEPTPAPEPAPEPEPEEAEDDPWADDRDRMVRLQIARRDVTDPRTLAALRAVPRHEFVPHRSRFRAYEDRPLPIGYGQTISQPYIVASMTEELRLGADAKVLEIGTGSGYQAAVLAEITTKVFTIEIVEELATAAAVRLRRLGYDHVTSRNGDGWHGWPEEAPFDAIVVTAAARQIPPKLVKQLAPGGRMVIPVGRPFAVQSLILLTKDAKGDVTTRNLYSVRFVPFTRARGKDETE